MWPARGWVTRSTLCEFTRLTRSACAGSSVGGSKTKLFGIAELIMRLGGVGAEARLKFMTVGGVVIGPVCPSVDAVPSGRPM
jgi:hypothetical protein